MEAKLPVNLQIINSSVNRKEIEDGNDKENIANMNKVEDEKKK